MGAKSKEVYTDITVPYSVMKSVQLGPKEVYKMGTSGAIYLHKSHIGKKYLVILIPEDEFRKNNN